MDATVADRPSGLLGFRFPSLSSLRRALSAMGSRPPQVSAPQDDQAGMSLLLTSLQKKGVIAFTGRKHPCDEKIVAPPNAFDPNAIERTAIWRQRDSAVMERMNAELVAARVNGQDATFAALHAEITAIRELNRLEQDGRIVMAPGWTPAKAVAYAGCSLV